MFDKCKGCASLALWFYSGSGISIKNGKRQDQTARITQNGKHDDSATKRQKQIPRRRIFETEKSGQIFRFSTARKTQIRIERTM